MSAQLRFVPQPSAAYCCTCGHVSAKSSNFVNVNEGRFVCQLLVDSTSGCRRRLQGYGDGGLTQEESECLAATIGWSTGDAELLTIKSIEIGAKLAPEGPTREADLILNATEAP